MAVAAERVLNLRYEPAAALAEVQDRIQRTYDHVLHRWDVVGRDRIAEWRADENW
jgi:hypothetical protein